MNNLLHIDSSPRTEQSHSRKLTQIFVKRWLDTFPRYKVTYRDLYVTPPPHVTLPWIQSAFTPEEERSDRQDQALEISDLLVDEFLTADALVMGVPMYNFGMPSILKAYVDNIVRVGRTFDFDARADDHYTPLVDDMPVFVIIATGDDGYGHGERLETMNHLAPHLKTVFGFIGIRDITYIYTGNDEFGGEELENSLNRAAKKVEDVIDSRSANQPVTAGGCYG